MMSNINLSEDHSLLEQIWKKAHKIKGQNSSVYRKDEFCMWIKYSEYGNHADALGWEVDYVVPKSEGGTNDISNLKPIQWKNKEISNI